MEMKDKMVRLYEINRAIMDVRIALSKVETSLEVMLEEDQTHLEDCEEVMKIKSSLLKVQENVRKDLDKAIKELTIESIESIEK